MSKIRTENEFLRSLVVHFLSSHLYGWRRSAVMMWSAMQCNVSFVRFVVDHFSKGGIEVRQTTHRTLYEVLLTYRYIACQSKCVFPSKDLVRFFWVHHFCSEFWWVGKALPCETHGFHIDFSQCHRKSSLKQWKGYEWRSFNPSRFMLHVDSYLLCLWGFSSWLHPEVISRC